MELTQSLAGAPALKFENPKFEHVESKWSAERQKNVEDIASEFNGKPNEVKTFSDPKLGSEPLVLLRKSKFESLVKIFRDLNNGQAHIRLNIDMLVSAITILESRISEKKIEDKQVIETLKILSRVTAQISSEIYISGHKKAPILSKATDEELDGLPE